MPPRWKRIVPWSVEAVIKIYESEGIDAIDPDDSYNPKTFEPVILECDRCKKQSSMMTMTYLTKDHKEPQMFGNYAKKLCQNCFEPLVEFPVIELLWVHKRRNNLSKDDLEWGLRCYNQTTLEQKTILKQYYRDAWVFFNKLLFNSSNPNQIELESIEEISNEEWINNTNNKPELETKVGC